MVVDESTFQDPLLTREYLNRAHDFYVACRCLPEFHRAFLPAWPQLALFGLAIELVLKGFLLSRGKNPDELKKMGHNLRKLYSTSLQLGLPENDRIERMINYIDDTYSIHMPRYPDPTTRTDPFATASQFYEDYDQLVRCVEEAII